MVETQRPLSFSGLFDQYKRAIEPEGARLCPVTVPNREHRYHLIRGRTIERFQIIDADGTTCGTETRIKNRRGLELQRFDGLNGESFHLAIHSRQGTAWKAERYNSDNQLERRLENLGEGEGFEEQVNTITGDSRIMRSNITRYTAEGEVRETEEIKYEGCPDKYRSVIDLQTEVVLEIGDRLITLHDGTGPIKQIHTKFKDEGKKYKSEETIIRKVDNDTTVISSQTFSKEGKICFERLVIKNRKGKEEVHKWVSYYYCSDGRVEKVEADEVNNTRLIVLEVPLWYENKKTTYIFEETSNISEKKLRLLGAEIRTTKCDQVNVELCLLAEFGNIPKTALVRNHPVLSFYARPSMRCKCYYSSGGRLFEESDGKTKLTPEEIGALEQEAYSNFDLFRRDWKKQNK